MVVVCVAGIGARRETFAYKSPGQRERLSPRPRFLPQQRPRIGFLDRFAEHGESPFSRRTEIDKIVEKLLLRIFLLERIFKFFNI